MTFKYRYRKQILIGICCVLVIGIISFISIKNVLAIKKEESPKKVVATFVKKKDTSEKEKQDSKSLYKVDIKGEVINPGIYSLDSNARVIDVINMAGGLTEVANTSVINLSKKISDEMVIIIYSNEQVANFVKTKELEKEVLNECKQSADKQVVNDACIEVTDDNQEVKKVALNTATIEELMQLPGIGEAKAKDIISYRDSIGSFKTIEEIKNVSGIGDSVFAKIKDYLIL